MLKTFTSTHRDWLSINQLDRAHSNTAQSAAVARTRLEYLRPVLDIPDIFHPFRLYQTQRPYRSNPDPETDWRTFRIRSGYVMGTDAIGTDDLLPDTDDPTETETAYILPDSSTPFWFWLEIIKDDDTGAYTATVRYSATPTESTHTDGLNDNWTTDTHWETYPVPDAQHIPIAKVILNPDTHTATIRQYLRTDLLTLGAGTTECPAG